MKNKRKMLVFFSFFISIIFFSSGCQASFSVPAEIKIKTDNNLQASKDISVFNHYNKDINISWFLEKTPQNYLVENRSNIPDSTWIRVVPKWQRIQPKKGAVFEINIDIPGETENYNQRWQVWLTFTTGKGMFSYETSTRLLIDTPEKSSEQKDETENIEINMEKRFFHGNTTKKITVTNHFEKEIIIESISQNPDVISKKNYTKIPDLSWITTNPTITNIRPGETKNFYIYIDPEEKKEYTNKNWETWIVFEACYKDNKNDCFMLDRNAKVFITTSESIAGFKEENQKIEAVSTDEPGLNSDINLFLFSIVFILGLAGYIFYRKKIK